MFPYISLNLEYGNLSFVLFIVDWSKDWDYNTRSIYAYVVVSVEGDKVHY